MTEEIGGFAFPFRLNQAGGVATAAGDDKLKENLKHLLLSGAGERVMLRGYGGNVSQLVHDPNNEALRMIVQHQIAKAVNEWEPRVQIQGVTVTQQEGGLFVEIRYVVARTGQPQSVSVPLGLGGI